MDPVPEADGRNACLLNTDRLHQLCYELEMAVSTAYLLKDGILYADATARDLSQAVELIAGVLDRIAADMKRTMELIMEEETD